MDKPWIYTFTASVEELGDFDEVGHPCVNLQYPSPSEESGGKLAARVELPVSVLRVLGSYLYDEIGLALVAPADALQGQVDRDIALHELQRRHDRRTRQVETALAELQSLSIELASPEVDEILLKVLKIMRKIEEAGNDPDPSA